MESLRTKIEEALNKLVVHRRPGDFQRIAFHVASLSWPELRATTLTSDLGADALIPFQEGKTKLVLACGINGDLAKFKEDCERLQETGRKPDEVVFATTLPVTELSEQKWREEIRDEFGIHLRDVIQREWIISELEKEPNRWLCKEYLEIPLPEFQNLPAILPRIRSAAQKLLNAYKGEYELPNQFLIDLSLEEFGASGATSLQLSHLPSRLCPADCCSITGVPGAGKTFSLFTIGSELLRNHSLIPIFVSLRAFSHREYKLIDWIVSEPSFEEQGITASELSNAASAGVLLLLLNGWNEIARDAWLATTEAISSFIRQMPGCGILVASRESLGRDFKFPTREFRVKSLSGDQIRAAIMQAALDDPDRQADLILNSIPLSEIAAVPLFLQAIIREIKSGNQLPLGKQAMLRRMVERAVEEHRSDLEHGEVRQHGLRYLAELAWEMTRTGRTAIPKKEAHQTISETTRKLKDEALLGAEPAPPDILQQLIAGHMLISVSRDEVAFTHQLIQEHFAATKIVSILVEKSADLELALTALTDYQWEQPLFLALEDLADQNRTAEIRILLDRFRFADFETACRMAGIVKDFWPDLQDLLEPTIRHLASSENVNARWLAARCSAATGQPSFRDLVWTALKGHPQGSSDCFEGISSTFILRTLGEEFSAELQNVPDDNFRFDALAIIGRTPTAESLRLAETLALKDPAPIVRRLVFRQLFLSGRRRWIRRFFRDTKDQGWPQGTLGVLEAVRRCTASRFRKFASRCLEMQATTEQRIKTLAFWSRVDPVGASSMARKEYDRLVQIDPGLSQGSERLFCLRTGANDAPQWAAPRLVREVLSSNDIASVDFQLLRSLPDQARDSVVKELLPELVKKGSTSVLLTHYVAALAPLTAASFLLRTIVGSDDEEERQRLRQVLHEVNHAAVIRAAMHDDFENLNPAKLRALLRAINVGFPGGNPNALQQLSNEELTAYRGRLLHWLSLLPQPDQDTAFDWANCATLIGEIKNPDDAELLYGFLRADEARTTAQLEVRKQEIGAWEASGRTATRPGPIVQTSYGNWHIAALANIPGERCRQIMIELLSHPVHIGAAAHYLANSVGAPEIDLSGSFHSRPRFDLIYERRSAPKALGEQASEYEAAIKRAIDERLSQHPINQNPLFSAFSALARLSGRDNESWILERLERYFPSGCIESILETITLAGGSLSGERILPFVRNTVTFALSEPWSNHEKSFLVTKALGSLFFSDSPGMAIALLKGEAAWFLKSHQFRSLLQMLVWERSAVVDAWLHEIVGESNDLSIAVLECLAERALIRNDQPAALDVACRTAQVTNLDPAGVARRGTTRLAAESETFRGQLFARAKDAQSIAEAAGWLKFISEIGGDDGVRTAFELAERFGEQLGVVSSIAPNKQEGTSLAFHGWFYRLGGMSSSRALYYIPEIMGKLSAFATGPDPLMGTEAERALLWIERERILAGTPPIGPRPLPPRVKTAAEDSPWQLRLQYERIVETG